jgi:peptidoglycan/xylan/chitin deacetylase (PgdA/CDA1 family)
VITVAVCTSGGRPPLDECLAALPPGTRVFDAPASWQARAQALAECATEVLALVDGDVVVPAGWLERLEAQWRSAGTDIAAIGGPISIPDAGDDWRASALGGVDYGDAPMDLDPLERTLFAGNLSFRRRALVGVGGFQPPVDGRDGVDWLSEEHEAQRQLGHWGWLERYVPELRARRIAPDKPRIAARRFRYGVRQGIARSRPVGAAATQALASAAGIPVALARGDRRAAAERAARAAENAGLVLAPIVAPRAWQLGAPATTLHPAAAPDPVTGAPATPTRRPVHDLPPIVLLYHRVASPAEDPLRLCVSPANFREQVAVLTEELEIVPMAALAAERRPGTVAITFDDGYLDNLTAALPVVAEAGASMTLFATTGRVTSGERFEWDEGELMTAEQAREFAAHPSADLSAHTRNHPSLAGLTRDEAWDEIAGSREDAAALRGGDAPAGFAYPFGILRQNVDDQARRLVEEAGYEYAVVNQPIPVSADHDRFVLPRFFAPNVGAEPFRAWLRARI